MNSEITPVLEKIKGTEEYDILVETEACYQKIDSVQAIWYEQSKFFCPEGCGRCCEHFEPDLLENEALYMAAWLIANQPEVAAKVAEGIFPNYASTENVSRETKRGERRENELAHFHDRAEACRPAAEGDRPNKAQGTVPTEQLERRENGLAHFHDRAEACRPATEGDRPNMSAGDSFEPFSREDGCPFFNSDSPHHCTIYNGRASICRLFGASGFRDKFGNEVWKPCKFYPVELLEKHNPPLAHRQYSAEEIRKAFGAFPPVMSDLMEQEETFTPDDDVTRLVQDVLPERVQHLMWIMEMAEGRDIH